MVAPDQGARGESPTAPVPRHCVTPAGGTATFPPPTTSDVREAPRAARARAGGHAPPTRAIRRQVACVVARCPLVSSVTILTMGLWLPTRPEHAMTVDPPSYLFGVEEEFQILDVDGALCQRIDELLPEVSATLGGLVA